MHSDPAIFALVSGIFIILILGTILRKLNQSLVIAYLFAGFLLGPHMFALIKDQETMTRLGGFGLIFVLFFVGMDISMREIAKNWLISVIGTFLQIGASVFFIYLLSFYFNWPVEQIILLGFMLSLSSSAIVIKLLEDSKELDSRVGQDVLGILLFQDILVAPMLICLSLFSVNTLSTLDLLFPILGAILFIILCLWLGFNDYLSLPWLKHLKEDHDLQLFASLGLCLGMAMLTGYMNLSIALGAFAGGMIIGTAKETNWVRQKLLSIRTLFLGLFFISIGMLLDIDFFMKNIWLILILVIVATLINTLINTTILKFLGEEWKISLYGGSLLSQMGEFNFVISSYGYHFKIINYETYELSIVIICTALLISPFWIQIFRQITK